MLHWQVDQSTGQWAQTRQQPPATNHVTHHSTRTPPPPTQVQETSDGSARVRDMAQQYSTEHLIALRRHEQKCNAEEISCVVIDEDLVCAATRGSPDELELLLAKGESANAETEGGQTAVHIAARCNNEQALEVLLKHGGDVNHSDHKGRSPVFTATSHNSLLALSTLLQHSAEPNQRREDGATPLCIAVLHNNVEALQLLLEHGGDPNMAMDGAGQDHKNAAFNPYTPYYIAAVLGQNECLKVLLSLSHSATTREAAPCGTMISHTQASSEGLELTAGDTRDHPALHELTVE